jgi:tetratricopeptide (TPR) repeat protein
MKHRQRRILSLIAFLALAILVPAGVQADPYTSVMRKGNRYYRNSLFREALGYFQEGGEKNPNSVVPLFNTGTTMYKMEDYINSADMLTQALERTKDDEEIAQIHYNIGNSYYQVGSYEKAAEHYIQALEKNPYDLNTKFNLEMALKKLADQAAPSQEETQDEKDSEGPREAEGDLDETGEHKGSSGEQEPGEKEFTQQDAQRLVDSVNNDQSRILNEIIQNRAGKVQNEKDW